MKLIKNARKNHICCLCNRKILKGERYWNTYDAEENSSLTTHEHTNCELFKDKDHDNE